MVTVPTRRRHGCQEQNQDGRRVTAASVSHPQPENNEKTMTNKPPKRHVVRVGWHHPFAELSSMQAPMSLLQLLCHAGRWLPRVASSFCTALPFSLLAQLGSHLARLGTDTFDHSAVLGQKAVPLSANSMSPQPCWAQLHFAAFCSVRHPRATLPLLSTLPCRSIPEECRRESRWWHRGQGLQV